MGITYPGGKGQERVVRMAYEKAGLDPRLTPYAELHGTGTPVGDPIEVRAISKALNDTRPEDRPLFMGAVSGLCEVVAATGSHLTLINRLNLTLGIAKPQAAYSQL